MDKTWKREIGSVLLIIWSAITWKIFWGISDVEMVIAITPVYNGLSFILLPTAISTFLGDAVLKHFSKSPPQTASFNRQETFD